MYNLEEKIINLMYFFIIHVTCYTPETGKNTNSGVSAMNRIYDRANLEISTNEF